MIYLDNGATTQVSEGAFLAMLPYLKEEYGNSFGVYEAGRKAAMAVERAREQVAALIHANPREIYFTSGGTESDNWALMQCLHLPGRTLVTSKTEHHAILHTAAYLEEFGVNVLYLDPDEDGMIRPLQIGDADESLRNDATERPMGDAPEISLVSLMASNNEIGTLAPLKELSEAAHRAGALFHTDGVQAVGHIEIDVNEIGCDMLSASAHKFGGPKGVGFLYIRNGVQAEPFMHGGSQERKLRAGTINTPGIVGMGQAAEEARMALAERTSVETGLRNHMIERILGEIPETVLNGPNPLDGAARHPGNVNVMIPGVRAESALYRLDREGIFCSAGSACSAGGMEPSHVLTAIGRNREEAFSSLRFTLSYRNTIEEIDRAVDTLKKICTDIRQS